METTQSTTQGKGKLDFLSFPIDKVAVGHAGIYVNSEDEVDTIDTQPEIIEANIPLGLAAAGKTLLNTEKGIKTFVKDVLAANGNHLPNTETGVWVHYLTEGIARDFNRTWEKIPTALREKQSAEDKKLSSGKRVITKKEKNELLEQLDISYYQRDIDEGKITLPEALGFIQTAYEYKKKLEEAGYYLSPNKTQGVSLLNWEQIVHTEYGTWDAIEVYKANKIDVVVPNAVENFFTANPKKVKSKQVTFALTNPLTRLGAWSIAVKKEMKNFGTFDENTPEKGGIKDEPINSLQDLINIITSSHKNVFNDFDIKLVHLGKLLPISKQNCYVIFDGIHSTKGRGLYLFNGDGFTSFFDTSNLKEVIGV